MVDSSVEVGLIVECELADDRSVRATIYYAGNTSGKKPSLIVPDDSLNFYMGLANLDVGHKFVQDEMEKEKYLVSSELLQIEPGKAYRFYGERYTESLFSKVLRVPQRVLMDSFHIKEIKTEVDNFIVLDCNIFLLGDPRQLQFLYIRAEGINDEPIEYEFDENSHIYRVLNHRKGFLVYNQVQAFPNLKFKLKLPADYSHKKIKLITGHTTDTYYYHNLYLSNSFGSTINQQNPPIYPSNINTTNANGIFSAASFSEHVLDIR